MKKTKGILFILMAMTLAIVLSACSSEEKEETKDDENKEGEVVTYMLPSEVLEKIDNKETFAFVIGNKLCGACNMYKAEALKEFSEKDGIKLSFVETLDLDKNEKNADDFVDLVENHLDKNFEATPTTYFIVDGKLAEFTVGAMPYSSLVEKYEAHIGSKE